MPSEAPRQTVSLRINGEDRSLAIDPAERLLDTLRLALRLTGTKEGCGEGECGACTVLLDDVPVNSCLILTAQVQGQVIETIEVVAPDGSGAADDSGLLTALLESGATQCGACTPGVVLTARWVLDHPELLESHGLRQLMAGNLCRCTGYDGIIEGLERALARRGEGA